MKLLVEKLEMSKNKFLLAEDLKEDCEKLHLHYLPTIKYLLRNKYIVRILKGIFYVKSIEERKLNKVNISHYFALKKAFEFKGLRNWYFGLDTALKFNNLTHEYFTIDYVLSDSVFRPKPINVMGHTIKFIKFKKALFGFGIVTKNINYSDSEKTILDTVYINKYHGLSDAEIKNKIIEFIEDCSKKKIKKYLKYYPFSVKKFMEGLV